MEFFRSQEFSAYIKCLMSQYHTPGLSIAITYKNETASIAFGYASLNEPSQSCTPDTLFDIASCSKSLTAASIGLLVDDNDNFPDVQYEAKMCDMLPEGDFVMPEDRYTGFITIEDVLGHRTGMLGHNDSYMSHRALQPDNARSITRNLRNLPVAAPPRERYLYCNMMYTAATYLVEVKTQQKFPEFLMQRFFTPLNMSSTHLQPDRARSSGLEARFAVGHIWKKRIGSYQCVQALESPEGQGAGSIISSTNDFIKWVKALLNREKPINENIYQGLIKMRSFVNPNPGTRSLRPHTTPRFYAAGLDVYWYRGSMVIGHNGVVPGFASHFFFMPEHMFGAVILANSSTATGLCTILTQGLIDEILSVPESERRHKIQRKEKTASKTSTNRKSYKADRSSVPNSTQSIVPTQFRQNMTKDGSYAVSQRPGSASQLSSLTTQTPASAPIENLNLYTGTYCHPGYHSIKVQMKQEKLFVDARDRSSSFTLTFKAKPRSEDDHSKVDSRMTVDFIAEARDWFENSTFVKPSSQSSSNDQEDEGSFEVYEETDDEIEARFVFPNDKFVENSVSRSKPLRLGLKLEEMMDGLIWFERVGDSDDL